MKDYYSVLGLAREASAENIKQRFKELAFEYHPDVSGKKNTHEKFIEIFEAYHILSIPDKKVNYDLLYDKYINRTVNQIHNEESLNSGIQYSANSAREKAQQKAKVKYTDFIKEMDCFFIADLKADGKPFYYNMHKNIGISGGTGPMGSIRSKTVSIPVPRSKKAVKMHRIGTVIKTLFLIIIAATFKLDLLIDSGLLIKSLYSVSIILLGGMLTHFVYMLKKTKSKCFHAHRYILVKKYKKMGFKRGFHPMISTTPVGLFAFVLRWIF